MEIRVKNIKGKKYEFVNEYWETSYAWGHKTTLLINGIEVENVKVRYYNRTWECYTYQSSMYRVLEKYAETCLKRYLENYLYNNGKSKFGKNEKQKAIEEYKKTDTYKTIRKLHKAIELRNFSK